ncbi:MAG: putative O-glycosylation ligase, exosortase A system-associated [Planctomycetes bacterium]|nr:putative O-glycosylation ligase, exosortase A system-associated [Planctomycetota bacterium]
MRDLLVLAAVLLLLPGSFRRPFVGLLLFSWLAYMRPQDLCWSFARTMRLSFVVGLVMFAGWWANERGRRPFARWDFRSQAVLWLGLLVSVSYAFAGTHDENTNRYYFEFVKILAIALFTSGQVDTVARFRLLAWTIALSLAFFGVKGGLFGVLTGGRPILRGPGGMLEDNNDFALALVMNVPLLWYLGIGEGKAWVRRATQVGVVLTIVTVVLTHSRGAFLALSATALWIAWRSGRLVRAVALLGLLGGLFLALAPPEVLERLGTIGDPQESSTRARLTSWGIAMRMIGDNPLLGVGLRNFDLLYRDYSPVPIPEGQQAYVAHNSYLQIWAESGTLAFVVYLLLLGSVFVACRWVWRVGRVRPDLAWAGNHARMLEATTVGFLVGAFFLNRGHFDLIYHWLALVTALVCLVQAECRKAPAAAAGVPAAARRRVTVRWRGRVQPAIAVAGQAPRRWARRG